MTTEILLSFTLTSCILCFSPGPIIFMVIGQALAHGKKSALPLVSGVFLGDILVMIVSFAGLGVLLSASATVFSFFKWGAAAYLIYLGIKTWMRNCVRQSKEKTLLLRNFIFRQSFLVAALNPKGMIFYAAFFPLFIVPDKPFLSQIVILGATFQLVSMMSTMFYIVFSNHLRNRISSIKFQSNFNKVSGIFLIAAGAFTTSIES